MTTKVTTPDGVEEWSDQQLIEACRSAAEQQRAGRMYSLHPWVLDALAARLEALTPKERPTTRDTGAYVVNADEDLFAGAVVYVDYNMRIARLARHGDNNPGPMFPNGLVLAEKAAARGDLLVWHRLTGNLEPCKPSS